MAPDGGMFQGRTTRVLTAVIAVALAGTVMALGQQNRRLRQERRDIVRRFTQPHPGMLVPAFVATSLAGDTVTIGESRDDERQVLFFFTTTCRFCRSSLPAVAQLKSTLAGAPDSHARLFAIGLDSVAAVRRFADSVGLGVPVLLMPSARLALLYRVRAVPQVMVLDSAGRTVYARSGALTGAGVVDSIVSAARQRSTITGVEVPFALGAPPGEKRVTEVNPVNRR